MVSKRHRMSLSPFVEQSSGRKARISSPANGRTLATTRTVSDIRILLVDDHPVVRAGLASMLSTIPGLSVCGAASTGEEALQLIDAKQPDVLLLDLRMPGMTGIELLRAIRGTPLG